MDDTAHVSFEAESLYSPGPGDSPSESWPRSRRMSVLSTQSTVLDAPSDIMYEADTLHYSQAPKSKPGPIRYGALPVHDYPDEAVPSRDSTTGGVVETHSRRKPSRRDMSRTVLEIIIGKSAFLESYTNLMSVKVAGPFTIPSVISSPFPTQLPPSDTLCPFR